ncbi:hypothetical protein [Streptomyces sp. KL116D]
MDPGIPGGRAAAGTGPGFPDLNLLRTFLAVPGARFTAGARLLA